MAERYRFSSDWFTPNIPNWKLWLADLMGKPGLRLVEVGSYEGRSAVWMLDELCAEPSSVLTCIDIWRWPPTELQFDANVVATGRSNQVRKIKDLSYKALASLPPQSCDFAYIDGSHEAHDVLSDSLLAIEAIKPGGLLIFDDYKWTNPDGTRYHPPEPAIDAFVHLNEYRIEVIHVGYQVAVRRRKD